MGIYSLLLHRKKDVEEQEFLTVSILSLTNKHKEEAIKKICDSFKEKYELLQISKMQFMNLFRFL